MCLFGQPLYPSTLLPQPAITRSTTFHGSCQATVWAGNIPGPSLWPFPASIPPKWSLHGPADQSTVSWHIQVTQQRQNVNPTCITETISPHIHACCLAWKDIWEGSELFTNHSNFSLTSVLPPLPVGAVFQYKSLCLVIRGATLPVYEEVSWYSGRCTGCMLKRIFHIWVLFVVIAGHNVIFLFCIKL